MDHGSEQVNGGVEAAGVGWGPLERSGRDTGSVSDSDSPATVQPAVAMASAEVFPPEPPVAVLRGGLAVGVPSYEAVLAEHVPLMPGGGSCRACGFVYTDQRACPALILAAAGHPDLADRIRIVPAADPDYRALCELTVAVERMDARLDLIGARVADIAPEQKARPVRRWARIVGSLI